MGLLMLNPRRWASASNKRGAKADELTLNPLELIDRIAALVPPPRTHRHRYFVVLAPNSPLRTAVTALAAPAHYLWAVLIARLYEIFPLLCPLCGGQMRIIAFITHSADIRQILNHIGADSEPPHISPARGPPLWDDGGDAQMGDGVQTQPDWEMAAQPVNW